MADSSHSSSDPRRPDPSLSASLFSSEPNSLNQPLQQPEEGKPEALAQYTLAFRAAIARQFPLNSDDLQALDQLQNALNLSDDQVRQVSQTVKAEVEQDTIRYQAKVRQYERKFAALVEESWPLSSAGRAILNDLQAQLHLHDIDVQTLEHQIIAHRSAQSAAATPPGQPPTTKTIPTAIGYASSPTSTPQPDNEIVVDSSSPILPVYGIDSSKTNSIPVPPDTSDHSSSSDIILESSPTLEVEPSVPASVPDADTQPSQTTDTNRNIDIRAQDRETGAESKSSLVPETVLDNSLQNQKVTLLSSDDSELEEGLSPSLDMDANSNPDHSSTLSNLAQVGHIDEAGQGDREVNQHNQQHGASDRAIASSDDVEQEEKTSQQLPSPDLTAEYNKLEDYLKKQEWQNADAETLVIMRKATAGLVSWMDPQAIRELPCQDLDALDRLWDHYSDGKFGFRVQHQIYETTPVNSKRVTRFGKAVGWTLFQREFIGFKYYQQLTFDLNDAPPGHLPAKWFWELPLWESIRSGGLGTGRGGCGDDAAGVLFEMMYQLVRCSGASH